MCCIQHGSALLRNSFPSLAMIQQMIRHESSLIIFLLVSPILYFSKWDEIALTNIFSYMFNGMENMIQWLSFRFSGPGTSCCTRYLGKLQEECTAKEFKVQPFVPTVLGTTVSQYFLDSHHPLYIYIYIIIIIKIIYDYNYNYNYNYIYIMWFPKQGYPQSP